jgi:hypothetical protein
MFGVETNGPRLCCSLGELQTRGSEPRRPSPVGMLTMEVLFCRGSRAWARALREGDLHSCR